MEISLSSAKFQLKNCKHCSELLALFSLSVFWVFELLFLAANPGIQQHLARLFIWLLRLAFSILRMYHLSHCSGLYVCAVHAFLGFRFGLPIWISNQNRCCRFVADSLLCFYLFSIFFVQMCVVITKSGFSACKSVGTTITTNNERTSNNSNCNNSNYYTSNSGYNNSNNN